MSLFANLISYVSTGETADAAEERGRISDANLREQNRIDFERNRAGDYDAFTRETYEQSNAQIDRGVIVNAADQVNAEFSAGLDDGRRNISGSVAGFFGVIGRGIGGVLLGVPVWVWLLVAGWAFFTFGGPGLVRAFRKGK